MKKLIKSALMLTMTVAVMAGSTRAWFTSTVSAQDNVIQTGTLLLGIDTARTDVRGDVWGDHAWNVVRENADGSVTVGTAFTPWTNAAPSDENSYYIALRQRGTVPMEVRTSVSGQWVDGPRFGTDSCPATAAEANHSLVRVSEMSLYNVGAATGCNNEYGCQNLRGALASVGPWTPKSGLTAGSVTNPTGWIYGTVDGTMATNNAAARFALEANEYAIYKVDVELRSNADNCYQGATYNLDVTAQGKQVDGAW